MHFYYAFKIPSGTVKYDWLSLHSILLRANTFPGLGWTSCRRFLHVSNAMCRWDILPPDHTHGGIPTAHLQTLGRIQHCQMITSLFLFFYFFAQNHHLPYQILFFNSRVSCLPNLKIFHGW